MVEFQSKWANPFSVNNTRSQAFTKSNGKGIMVEMMNRIIDKLLYFETSDTQAILLPYDSGSEMMLVVLSSSGVPFDLHQSFGKFTFQSVRVYLPKFTIQTEVQETLLGCLKITQKAKIEVNENETIARVLTVGTSLKSANCQLRDKQIIFEANRTFTYMIIHQTTTQFIPLFSGVYDGDLHSPEIPNYVQPSVRKVETIPIPIPQIPVGPWLKTKTDPRFDIGGDY